jgi:hypothetical protein
VRDIAPAWGAEVVSSNIVGYNKVTLTPGYNMIGIQFQEVGSANGSSAVSTYGILDSTFEGFDEDINFANSMQVWNGNGYTTYGWAGSSPSQMDPEYAPMDNTWLTFGGEPTDDTHTVGGGCWVRAATSGTITLSGEVTAAEPVEIPITAGYNMVANPFPMNVPVSTFGKLDSSFAGFDEDINFANSMQVWNGNGYTTYGWAATSPSQMDPEYAPMDNTWLTFGGEPTEDIVPLGHAVWIRAASSGTMTFTPPASE